MIEQSSAQRTRAQAVQIWQALLTKGVIKHGEWCGVGEGRGGKGERSGEERKEWGQEERKESWGEIEKRGGGENRNLETNSGLLHKTLSTWKYIMHNHKCKIC